MRWHPAWKYIHYVRGVSSIVSSLWKVNILFAAVTFFTSCILCSFCFPTSLNLWIPFCFRDHRIEGIAIHDKEGCCIVKGETFERDEQSHCEPIPLLWFVEAFHKHSSSVALTTTGLTNKIYRFIFPQKIAEACIISPAYSYPCMPQKKSCDLTFSEARLSHTMLHLSVFPVLQRPNRRAPRTRWASSTCRRSPSCLTKPPKWTWRKTRKFSTSTLSIRSVSDDVSKLVYFVSNSLSLLLPRMSVSIWYKAFGN